MNNKASLWLLSITVLILTGCGAENTGTQGKQLGSLFPITLSTTADVERFEESGHLEMEVSLAEALSEDIEIDLMGVDITAQMGQDYTLPESITIEAGTLSNTFEVTILDDMIKEPLETFSIKVTNHHSDPITITLRSSDVLFLSLSHQYTGNLGGWNGAQEKCETDSPFDSTMDNYPVISTTGNTVSSMHTNIGFSMDDPVQDIDGTIIFRSWDDFLNDAPAVQTSQMNLNYPLSSFWTGTSDSTKGLAVNCADFTETSVPGAAGTINDMGTTFWWQSVFCNASRSILCLSTPSP